VSGKRMRTVENCANQRCLDQLSLGPHGGPVG
jgi:hypothetical protein